MQEYTIERLGQPNLHFAGEIVGHSEGEKPSIRIFRTKAGNFVAESRYGPQRLSAHAEHFEQPEQVVAWLRIVLGSITHEAHTAIEVAAGNDEQFKKFWNLRVE